MTVCDFIRRPGTTPDEAIRTLGELRAIWPVLVPDPRYGEVPESDILCICPVDLPASAEANGAAIRRDDRDPSVWWLEPPPPTTVVNVARLTRAEKQRRTESLWLKPARGPR